MWHKGRIKLLHKRFRLWGSDKNSSSTAMLFCVFREKHTVIAQLVRIRLQCRRPQLDSWIRKIPWRRDRLPTPLFLGFPGGSAGKESACNVGDLGSIPRFGRSPGVRERLLAPVFWPGEFHGLHGVVKSQMWLSDFHTGIYMYMLKWNADTWKLFVYANWVWLVQRERLELDTDSY